MTAWSEHSLAVARQTAHGTINSTDADFQGLLCTAPQVSLSNETQEFDLLQGIVGAASELIVGRRMADLTFSLPLEGFVSGYDPTSEDPGGTPVGEEVVPMWFALAANAMGSNNSAVSSNANFIRALMASVSQYTAGGMASGTASSITCDDATASNKIDVGQLVVAALSATNTSPQIGFAKTKASQVITLFEAAKNNVNDAAAHLYGTATAYMSDEISSTDPLTFRWSGPTTALCMELFDAYCERIKITWESGEVPTVEFTYKCYDFHTNNQDGGLVIPAAYNRIPQIIGSVNGYATIDGTATCGLEACELEWTGQHRITKCHGANNGISAIEIFKPRTRLSCTIPHDDGDTIYDASGSSANVGQHVWQSALELGTAKSFGIYVGSQVGKIWSALLPSAKLKETPNVVLRDTTVAYQLTAEASVYTGDSTDTSETSADSPLDSIARIALG